MSNDLASILTSSSRKAVSDRRSTSLGNAHFPRQCQSPHEIGEILRQGVSWSSISLLRNLRHDSRVHLMAPVVASHANKVIAGRLGISQRTVENHRARVMDKMEARVLADLVRMASAIDIDKWSRGLATAPDESGSK